MEPVITPDERADGIDREKFREMLESASFGRLRDRIARELLRVIGDCQRLDHPRDIFRAQGAAQMTEAILRLPQVILAEMAPKTPQPKGLGTFPVRREKR